MRDCLEKLSLILVELFSSLIELTLGEIDEKDYERDSPLPLALLDFDIKDFRLFIPVTDFDKLIIQKFALIEILRLVFVHDVEAGFFGESLGPPFIGALSEAGFFVRGARGNLHQLIVESHFGSFIELDF